MADAFDSLPETLRPAPGPSRRKVGVFLFLGIVFLPEVFSWFTLREGYSKRARIWAIGWALSSLLIVASKRCSDTSIAQAPSPATAPAAQPAEETPSPR